MSRQENLTARSSDSKRSVSIIDVSSMKTASQRSGFFSPRLNLVTPEPSSKSTSSSRWTVLASTPVSSVIRLAARPVGAASATFSPICPSSRMIAEIAVVFPVPGPPVRIMRGEVTAVMIASRWSAA